MDITERFLKYVKLDTTPDSSASNSPTTQQQMEFAKVLVEDLKLLGAQNIVLDENGYVTAEIPKNIDKDIPILGLIAHMDTAPNYSGKNVNPRIVHNYDGGDITLNNELGVVFSPKEFPELLRYKGENLIVTDGTTLLGADDKAGIVEIMEVLKRMHENESIKHGTIKIAFTPDEEIGRGAELLDVKKFGADFAFTVDGGYLGGIEYENFNAANSTITITGRDIHTGTAKNKMINAISVGNEFDNLLPKTERPEYTEMYEGFYHLSSVNGGVESTVLKYNLRDHDREKFERKKYMLTEVAEFLEKKYPGIDIKVETKDSYFNMKDRVEPYMKYIDLAKNTMRELGIEPKVTPIRGGTDGARLSYRGLPCPNLFTGSMFHHGKYECVSIEALKKTANFLERLVVNFSKLS